MTTAALIAGRARLFDARFWRAYGVTMRPYLMFVSGVTGIAGISLAGDSAPGAALLVGFALFLSYGFGQALTDCFQMDTDARSAPWRPLVTGVLHPVDVMGVSLFGLAGCGVIVTWLAPANLLLAACAVAGLATYTWFKRRWWGGPWWNAWIVMLLVPMGLLGAGGTAEAGAAAEAGEAGVRALIGTMTAAFFGYAHFVVVGYFKDLEADRATGYRTLPVVFGRWAATRVSDVLAALALAGAAIAIAGTGDDPTAAAAVVASVPFLVLAVLRGVAAQSALRRVRRDREAWRAIVPGLHAYGLLMAGLAAFHQPLWTPALIVFCVLGARALARRPERAQV